MNGLALATFDAGGVTAWREQTLSVDPNGESVQIDVVVANVGDAFFDSLVRIDLIEENQLEIAQLTLNDIDDSALDYLSASSHTYFGGSTRVHGTITLLGPENDTVEDVELDVVQGGSVVATGTLASSAQSILLQQFGTDNEIIINSSQHLFDLKPGGINSAANGQLSLRVKVRTDRAEEATKDSGNVTIIKRYTGTDRYGPRDVNSGGDDWAIPGVADYIDGLTGYQWGDFSNMNAGAFPNHASHKKGVDVDGWFNGYNARDANTANIIVMRLTILTAGLTWFLSHMLQMSRARFTRLFKTLY